MKERQLPWETEVSLTLVDDVTIQNLNRDYRGVDAPTDVLSFSLEESREEEPAFEDLSAVKILGDIVISLETASRQSEEYGHSLEREVAFLTVHGLLHLLGYDHQRPEEEAEMEQMQEVILGQWPQLTRLGNEV